MIKLQKTYDPKNVEDKIYKLWEKSGYFNPDNLPQRIDKYFSIVMPPPNVTGTLHLGHAVMLAIEDILIRFHRMRGENVLWLPGTDHAAIATQTKVEKILKEKEGKTRHDLGRDKFLKEVEKFITSTQNTIKNQIRKMGSSCDWSREAYTLDEQRSLAVYAVFKMMYDDGLIYRGSRIVNWDPTLQTTISDDEVEWVERKTPFYYLKYGPFIIGTARPETKFGDKYVVMHPNDQRYKKYKHGQKFTVEWINGPITATIIKDRAVDMNFGTGVMTITPWHDATDFEIAERHKLDKEQIIDFSGQLLPIAGEFTKMSIKEARPKIVEKLRNKGLLDHVEENYVHRVATNSRGGALIEPQIKKQWFINVNKSVKRRGGKTLKQLMREAVASGKIKIIPQRFKKVYFHWIDNLRDWNISRQIWFGHRIPIWYHEPKRVPRKEHEGGMIKCKEVIVSETEPTCEFCDAKFIQDPDTLDTWFSSGLWTFSTLGWPKKTRDLENYHPTSVLETGYDLLFFWIARMILMTTYALGDIPFYNVYLHGLVRDEKGRKMSKSLGNIINPLDMIKKYGADAVRLSLVLGTSPANDIKLGDEKIAGFRNFTNKLWNIGRYVMASTKSKIQNPKQIQNSKFKIQNLTLTEKWILSRLNSVIDQVTNHLNKFEFSQAGEKLRTFTWNEFADWYIEINKIQPNNSLLLNSYFLILKLWHPFMPFVTEELWTRLGKGNKKLLMIAEWPESNRNWQNKKAEKDFEILRNIVIAIRSLRTDYKIEPKKKILAILYGGTKTKLIGEQADIIKFLAGIGKLEIKRSGKKPPRSASAIVTGVKIYLPLAGLINIKEKRERLEKELTKMENYLAILKKKLTNKSFIKQAPKEIVAREKQKLQDQKEKLRALKNKLKLFK